MIRLSLKSRILIGYLGFGGVALGILVIFARHVLNWLEFALCLGVAAQAIALAFINYRIAKRRSSQRIARVFE